MDLLLSSIASLGASELGSILSSDGKNVIKNHKDANAWKKVFQGAGSAVLINDKQDKAFFKDLVCALSEGSMTAIASSIKNDDGYELKPKKHD